jgi:phosphoribosylamine-glycine ligase
MPPPHRLLISSLRIQKQPFDNGKVLHAGTHRSGGKVVTNGGGVLCAVGLGPNVSAAQHDAHALADRFTGRGCNTGATSAIARLRAKQTHNDKT